MDRFVIEGSARLQGEVAISGSKNASLPIMVGALLADSPSTIHNVPNLRDVQYMMQVLEALGAKVRYDTKTMIIDPSGFSVTELPYDIVRRMRASIYVLGPLLARLGEAKVSLPGGCAIGPRPIDLHLQGLRALGADILLKHGYIIAKRVTLNGGTVILDGPRGSSVGATCNVLMAASLSKGKTVIHGAAKEAEVVALEEFLNEMGAHISGIGESTVIVEGVSQLHGTEFTVIPDRIEAGTFMVATAITKGNVTIKQCNPLHLAAITEKMIEVGIVIEQHENTLRVNAANEFHPVSIRTLPYPDFPTDMQAQITALLTLVKGESSVTETIYLDRFIHVSELLRMGADITMNGPTAIIKGVPKLSGAPVMASDLRASAALIIAALAAEGKSEVLRIYHIDRGYERIEMKLKALGAKVKRISTSSTTTDYLLRRERENS